MTEKLTWDEIKQHYNKEWVLLIDYDWPDGTPWPKAGVVVAHAPNRKAFWQKANAIKPHPTDCAGFFVGPPVPSGVIRNNLMTVTECEK